MNFFVQTKNNALKITHRPIFSYYFSYTIFKKRDQNSTRQILKQKKRF